MKNLPKSSIRTSSRPKAPAYLGLLLFVLAAAAVSICVGSTALDFKEALSSLSDPANPQARILLYVRLPRTLAALLSGAALGVAGALIQGVLNNALAGPNIIGVNGGAGLFTLLAAAFLPGLPQLLPGAAFLGALCASLLIYGIAAKTGASRMTIVLAGIAVSNLFSAGIDTLQTVFPDVVVGSNTFLVGGLSGVTLRDLAPAGALIAVGIVLACIFGPALDLLALGEDSAKSLGLHVPAMRFVLLLTASLLAGAAVSFAGLLGFVGLLVPHAMRRFFGIGAKALLPACALSGAGFVAVCDTLARVIAAPYELPVGILLAFLGAPFFLVLLLQKKRGRIYD